MGLVLVVDDEQDAGRLMERVLANLGHEVYAFSNAEDALRWLQTNTPDLAVVDIKLRGKSGIGVLEHIHQIRPQTKILMVTGCPSAETTNKARELGAVHLLIKPIEIDELEKCVSRFLGPPEFQ